MKQRTKHLFQLSVTLLGVFAVLLSSSNHKQNTNNLSSFAFGIGSRFIAQIEPMGNLPDLIEYRIAHRLKKRLSRIQLASPSIRLLADAVSKRQELLKRSVSISLNSSDGLINGIWEVSLSANPAWIKGEFALDSAGFAVDEKTVLSYLETNYYPGAYPPKDITITKTISAGTGSAMRIETDGIAKAGYSADLKHDSRAIAEALNYGYPSLSIPLEWREGYVSYDNGEEILNLTLLSQGKSNFKGSDKRRILNVTKALNQHINNVIVPPGEKFSFNSTLDGPVSERNGWNMAKVILYGEQLVLQPGGGICQASTTVYRAIVRAGLPVIDRRAHSLYVTYYKKYGVGLDATIYPGSQDLAFLNDTDYPIVIQAFDTEEKDAIVNFYGVPDGRKVALEGPFFKSTAPQTIKDKWRAVKGNEIVWTQKVEYTDGTIKDNIIVSSYKTLPSSLPNEFIAQEEKFELLGLR